jgi:hypothetical protein
LDTDAYFCWIGLFNVVDDDDGKDLNSCKAHNDAAWIGHALEQMQLQFGGLNVCSACGCS